MKFFIYYSKAFKTGKKQTFILWHDFCNTYREQITNGGSVIKTFKTGNQARGCNQILQLRINTHIIKGILDGNF